MTLHHIDTAPMPEMFKERVPVLLYCPDDGGWHTGFWWDGSWRLHYDMQQILTPTHWLPTPLAVVADHEQPIGSEVAA